MQDKSVVIDKVSFAYEESQAILKNISLTARSGKITAIMGGSGSGKTTLLRLISGQIEPDSGSVNVLGRDLSLLNTQKILQLRKQIGMLFQFGALFTDMSVAENVAFAIHEHTQLPASLVEKIVAMKLNAVGLFGTQDMRPQELSGGMARRVALARSMALDPSLMLYDEPFTGLDPISLNVAAMLIKKISESLGQTVILVTHDIESSFKIADYVYFMASGEIVDHGTPKEIIATTNPAVKQFIHGEVDGPFSYEYKTQDNYNAYIGN